MRTTLTLDHQVLFALQEAVQRSGKPFKVVVNEALQLGLQALDHPPAPPYHLSGSAMGHVRPTFNLDKALQWADNLEDSAIAIKLERPK